MTMYGDKFDAYLRLAVTAEELGYLHAAKHLRAKAAGALPPSPKRYKVELFIESDQPLNTDAVSGRIDTELSSASEVWAVASEVSVYQVTKF